MSFIGREHEIEALRSALRDAASGAGGVVMLAGEAGIGKTRTAEELAAVAERERCRVRWGRAYEAEGTPPFWPWIQVLRGGKGVDEASELEALVGLGTAPERFFSIATSDKTGRKQRTC